MRLLHGIDGLKQVPHHSVVTIGNFDGMHRGHQHILQSCRDRAGAASSVVVVTFEPHPLTVLRPAAAAPRLTPALMKQQLIQQAGADVYVVLAPQPAVLNLTAEDFWALLRDEVRPATLVEGADFTFGKGRGGNVTKLSEWARAGNVRFDLAEPVSVALLDLKIVPVSSSLIRWLLARGRVRDAAICLGRPYALRGEVVKGFQRGRTIGVPTANLRCDQQLIPDDGVYAGRCHVAGQTFQAAVSIGDMPTFGQGVRQIEAHLLDFEGDLYGQSLDLELIDWLRDQRKFTGIPALKRQIDEDIIQTKLRRSLNAAEAIAQAAYSSRLSGVDS